MVLYGGAQWYASSQGRKIIKDEASVNSKSLWNIDRNAINQNSKTADRWSDVTLYGTLAMPILLNVSRNGNRGEGGKIALMGLQGFMVENGLNLLVKNLVKRPRPFIYDNPWIVKDRSININSSKSFYSGHTSGAAYFAFFGAKVFSDLHPDSKWKPYVWSVAIALPAVTGYLRYKAGKHFPTDVIVGYTAGAAIGYLIPTLYRSKNATLTIAPSNFSLLVKL